MDRAKANMRHSERVQNDREAARKRRQEQIMNWTTIAGVIVVAISATISAWTAMIMRDQLSVMAAQQRPWIEINPVPLMSSDDPSTPVSSLKYNQGGLDVTFKAQAKNLGQSVAEGLLVNTEIVALPLNSSIMEQNAEIRRHQDSLCRWLSQGTSTPEQLGDTVFPGETISIPASAWILKGDLVSALKGIRTFHAVVVGCADYRLYVSEKHFQTRFAYTVSSKNYGVLGGPVELYQDVKASDLQFVKFIWGNGSAN